MSNREPAASDHFGTQTAIDRIKLKLIDSWTILAKAGRCHVEAAANREPVEDPMELLEILLEGGRLEVGLLKDRTCQSILELLMWLPVVEGGRGPIDAEAIERVETLIAQLLCTGKSNMVLVDQFASIMDCLCLTQSLLEQMREDLTIDLKHHAAPVAIAAIRMVRDRLARAFPLATEIAAFHFAESVNKLIEIENLQPVDNFRLTAWRAGEAECDGLYSYHTLVAHSLSDANLAQVEQIRYRVSHWKSRRCAARGVARQVWQIVASVDNGSIEWTERALSLAKKLIQLTNHAGKHANRASLLAQGNELWIQEIDNCLESIADLFERIPTVRWYGSPSRMRRLSLDDL